MTTNAYAAKRAIFDRLIAAAAMPGTPLNVNGAVVQYAFNPNTSGNVTVYGGGVTFDQPGDEDAVNGERDRITHEVAVIGIHIRVQQPPDPVTVDQIRDTDEVCEQIGDWLGDWLVREPRLAGGNSVSRVISGRGDYMPTEAQSVSVLSYSVEVRSYIKQPST